MRPDMTVPVETWARLGPLNAKLEGERHAASLEADAAVAPHRPTRPHYFLGAVGTLPSQQGQGYGTAVLEPVLARAADEGALACLETCGEDNVRSYAGLGFEVTAEVFLPMGGLTT